MCMRPLCWSSTWKKVDVEEIKSRFLQGQEPASGEVQVKEKPDNANKEIQSDTEMEELSEQSSEEEVIVATQPLVLEPLPDVIKRGLQQQQLGFIEPRPVVVLSEEVNEGAAGDQTSEVAGALPTRNSRENSGALNPPNNYIVSHIVQTLRPLAL